MGPLAFQEEAPVRCPMQKSFFGLNSGCRVGKNSPVTPQYWRKVLLTIVSRDEEAFTLLGPQSLSSEIRGKDLDVP